MRRFSPVFTLALALGLLAAILGVLAPSTASAQSPATATILADRLNVRSGPGTGYAVAATAKRGEKYGVVGQNGNCAWLQIAKCGEYFEIPLNLPGD